MSLFTGLDYWNDLSESRTNLILYGDGFSDSEMRSVTHLSLVVEDFRVLRLRRGGGGMVVFFF